MTTLDLSFYMVILACITGAYLLVTFFLFTGLWRLRKPGEPQNLTYSVIIAAHNEEEVLEACLCSVLSQFMPESRYEVILADDRSTDTTYAVGSKFLRMYPNFSIEHITQTPAGQSPKKYALSRAISRAKNDIIVYTDADCLVTPAWLDTLDKMFAPDVALVQGRTSYRFMRGMNRLFYAIQSLDFLSHNIVSAAALGTGVPINSNANNLAFRKEIFERVGGYESVKGLVSGDDDLLLQRISREKIWKAVFMSDFAGAVTTLPTPTLEGIFEQRKRWGSKTVHYNARAVALLSVVFMFYLATISALAVAVVRPSLWPTLAGMLAAKLVGELLLMVPGSIRFHHAYLLPYLPIASVIQLPSVVVLLVLGVFGKFSWKGKSYTRKLDQSGSTKK